MGDVPGRDGSEDYGGGESGAAADGGGESGAAADGGGESGAAADGGAGQNDKSAAGGAAEHGGEGSAPPALAELLGAARAIRRKTRLARHAYWFPLVLFGLLICASVPFYLPPLFTGPATYSYGPPGPRFFQSGYLGAFGFTSYRGTAYYWLGALLLGIVTTVLWYRWRGNRVGLRTPARGYLIAGLMIVALALLVPLAGRGGAIGLLIMPGDLVIRGTFPFVLIGLGLCYLAWAERSVGLTAITVVYLAAALLASLYDVENVFYNWFGLYLSPTEGSLPNLLLPALVLLLSGTGAWMVQRRQRALGPED